jgi:hypothetical protein
VGPPQGLVVALARRTLDRAGYGRSWSRRATWPCPSYS